MTHPGSPVMTPGAWAAMTAWGKAPRGWARVSAGETSPGVARVPSTAAPATASCNRKITTLSPQSGRLRSRPHQEPAPKGRGREGGAVTHKSTMWLGHPSPER